jgi:serine phosphatase RsbU (regulator of sigma subunit)
MLLLALFIGLFLRRLLAPWVVSRSSPWLAMLSVAGFVPLAVGFAVGWGAPRSETALVRLDRATFTLVEAWILLAGFRAWAELMRRWVRRASVRTKLILSFAIFAVTPALLAFLYAALSGWIHSGELRATVFTRELERTSGGRGLIRRAERDPAPAIGADLAARIERERPVLADRGLAAVALERHADEWRVAGLAGDLDSLFHPAAAPVADSADVVRGLALRAGRIWWVETALWPDAGDSLALQTFEPVDTTRVNGLAQLLRCDAILFASPSIAATETRITLGGNRTETVRRFRAAGGAIDITTGGPAGVAPSDSAALDSLTETASLTLVGGGAYAHATSLRHLRGMFNSGASPPIYLWTGSGWRRSSSILLVRSSPWESVTLAGLGSGPFSSAMRFVLLFFAGLFLFVEIVSVVVGSRVARLITRAAAGLREAATAIGQGDFSVRVRVPSEDELGELATSFNRMARGLAEGQRAVLEREQMRRELELARRIQSRLLPLGPPVLPRLDVAASNTMSQQVGGDYYDFIPMGDGRLGLCIADVAGKGVAAALLMSSVKAALVSSAAVEAAPDRLAGRVNRLLEQSIEPGRFVTLFFASLDPGTLRLEYVNAGHPAPMLLRRDGALLRLEAGGTILGIDAGASFDAGSVTLGPGDLLALYTDGVAEAVGAEGELFGDERIEAILRADRSLSAGDVLDRLLTAVRAYAGDQGPGDDLTAVVLKVETG